MKILSNTGLILLVWLAVACNDFLDVVPKGKNTLNSLDDLETLLNDDYAGGWGISDAMSYIINERYPAETPAFYIQEGKGLLYGYMTWDESVDRVSLTSSDNLYRQTYSKITTYNVLLSKLGDVSGPETRKQHLAAEAQTLRAWCHWILVNTYAQAYTPDEAGEKGGIPYVEDVNFDEKNRKLSLAEVYEKLLADVSEENIALLPDQPQNIQRAGKAFGYAVRAKILLSMRNYEEALKAAESSLSYNDNAEDRRSFIGSTPVRERENAGNVFFAPGRYTAPVWNVISAEWAQLYEAGDIMFHYTDLYEDASETQGIAGCYTWRNGERYIYNSAGIRSEEMILVKAECQARCSNVNGAMATLNALRELRIHPDEYTPFEAATETEAMRYIILASRIEHLFTYNNFFNLKRWNTEEVYRQDITRTVNGITYRLKPDSPYWVMPFPSDATQYNASLTQNF